ncbi:MAG TPA: hypothetical protein VHK90_00890 [Thermoanaerobaculia bacterium]|nr:hypothetical protein [Thermoanaerobaculia bacterium]
MNALVLLLALTSTLVLRSGEKIAVEGTPRSENGVVTFRSGGVLYSLPASEVEKIEKNEGTGGDAKPVRRLRVSPEERKRLIEELERNHGGTPSTAPPPTLANVPPPPKPAPGDENRWRQEARMHEESIRRAKEELELLESRVEELRSQIQGFLSLGFKPHQFTYQTTRLQYTLDMIPRAKLEIVRAERAYVEFREDARKQGVLPGWLR